MVDSSCQTKITYRTPSNMYRKTFSVKFDPPYLIEDGYYVHGVDAFTIEEIMYYVKGYHKYLSGSYITVKEGEG